MSNNVKIGFKKDKKDVKLSIRLYQNDLTVLKEICPGNLSYAIHHAIKNYQTKLSA